MNLRMIIDHASQVMDGIYCFAMPPHQVRRLGEPLNTQGCRTVLLISEAKFDPSSKELQVVMANVTVLNLGTTTDTFAVSTEANNFASNSSKMIEAPKKVHGVAYGPGDKDFLALVEKSMIGPAKTAAFDILKAVRNTEPGDLKRGQRLNFTNTPDNFWYVIVQPRVQSLSITVRGPKEQFEAKSLELKTDRPGYTRFSLCRPEQVEEAFCIIQQSRRK